MMATTLQQWLQRAAQALTQLAAIDPYATDLKFEARRLAADLLQLDAAALQIRLHDSLTSEQVAMLEAGLTRRCQGEPLAYITGRWWFWDLELEVAPCTLIPRPDTELLVEQALQLNLPLNAKVLDLGTGTGAIALSLAKSNPQWQVIALDYSSDAVQLAERNRKRLHIQNCQILRSDWFDALPELTFDLILSNPPYIDANDEALQQGDVRFEPHSALVADCSGLADLQKIIAKAPKFLANAGWIWLEHGHQQADAVQQLLRDASFSHISSKQDYSGKWRITGGCFLK